MPAPVISTASYGWSTRTYCQFGGQAIPVGKNFLAGTMAYVDLNDAVNWFMRGLKLPDSRQLKSAQLLWRAKAVYMSEDYTGISIKIPFRYEESGSNTLAAARAQLLTAGTQYLTFDGSTAFSARCRSFGDPELTNNGVAPLRWNGTLDFDVVEPFLKDIASTSPAPINCTASGGGTNTNFTITYAGSFFSEPKFAFATANVGGNVTIQTQNTLSGESLTFTAAANGNTYTVDSSLFKVTDQNGNYIDVSGSFPMLYPPPATGNTFTVTCTGSAGTHVLTITYNNRWTA